MDDILVHIPGTPEEHLHGLEQVFQYFREANLTLKVEKCVFFKPNLPYLGHIIDKNRIKPDPAKVQAITEMRPSSTVTAVRTFAE